MMQSDRKLSINPGFRYRIAPARPLRCDTEGSRCRLPSADQGQSERRAMRADPKSTRIRIGQRADKPGHEAASGSEGTAGGVHLARHHVIASRNGRLPAISPASTVSVVPVIPLAAGEARKATAAATSSVVTIRPSG